MAVVWGSGSQHGRFERHDKIKKMPLKKKTLGLATNGQKMSKTEKGQKCCATKVCLHMAKQRWTNQHVCLQHTGCIGQNVRFWGTLAQNMSDAGTQASRAMQGGAQHVGQVRAMVGPWEPLWHPWAPPAAMQPAMLPAAPKWPFSACVCWICLVFKLASVCDICS